MIELKPEQIQEWMVGTATAGVAFAGIAHGLFGRLADEGPVSAKDLANQAGVDEAYCARWCEVAFAFGFLDREGDGFALSDAGRAALVPGSPQYAGGAFVNMMLLGHFSLRFAECLGTGDVPGEGLFAERGIFAPLFGPMLEANFKPLFEKAVLPAVAAYREAGGKGGRVLDLGCGNAWFLVSLARAYPSLAGVGVEGHEAQIANANKRIESEGLGGRLRCVAGDIVEPPVDGPFDLVTMNRSVHHVWDRKERLIGSVRDRLSTSGRFVVWDPNFPDTDEELRTPAKRTMVLHSLAEAMQGNRLMPATEIADWMRSGGFDVEAHLLNGGNEGVVVGRKRAS
ncbi:MAG: class I SAM-dependent methyltransferase [Nitrospirota bacterium]